VDRLPVEGQPEWKQKVGAGTSVAGRRRRRQAKASPRTQRIKGSIGYVEYAYAKKNKMSYAQVQNRDGNVQPDDSAFHAAAAGAGWKGTPGFGVILTDQPGSRAGRSPARASS
jgi:phosphate transport system substrate-binding protein